MTGARFYFRAIEIDGGRWACRRGRIEYDIHGLLQDAIEHLTILARAHQPSEVIVHHLDGRTRRVVTVDPSSP